VSPSLGVSSLKEFVALAKAKPGTINYGSAGIGISVGLVGVCCRTATVNMKDGGASGSERGLADPNPTALAQGVDYQYATWYGVLAPGKTPKGVLGLQREIGAGEMSRGRSGMSSATATVTSTVSPIFTGARKLSVWEM
jgi:hypothetical protein